MVSETQMSHRGHQLRDLMVMLYKIVFFAVGVVLTSSCWVSVPSYYYDFGSSCYPNSSLKINPYGQVMREHFSFYPRAANMIPPEGLRTAAALVELGVPVNEPVENGSTTLMWAS